MEAAVLFALLIGAVLTGLWLWSLIHCIIDKRLDDTMRIIGIILIVILGLLGSLIYIFLPRNNTGRRQGRRGYGSGYGRARRGDTRNPYAAPTPRSTDRGRETTRPRESAGRGRPSTTRRYRSSYSRR